MSRTGCRNELRHTRGLLTSPWYWPLRNPAPFSAVLITKCLLGMPAAASAWTRRAPYSISLLVVSYSLVFNENPRAFRIPACSSIDTACVNGGK